MSWTLFTLVVLGGMVGLVYAIGRIMLIWFAPLCFMFLPVIAAGRRATRERRILKVIGYLDQSVHLGLPLLPMLRAAAQSERGQFRVALTYMSELIARGLPIVASLKRAFPETPDRIARLLETAQALGGLEQALPLLVAEQRDVQARVATGGPGEGFRVYPVVLIAILCSVVLFLGTYVFPKFHHIQHDFGLPMNGLTRTFYYMAEVVLPPLLLVTAVMVIVINVRAFRSIFVGDRTALSRVTTDMLDRIWAVVPFFGSLRHDRRIADLLDVLARQVKAGRPLGPALDAARGLDNGPVLRKRLREWSDRMKAGQLPAEAARAARLPHMVVGLLDSSQATGQLHAPLAFLANYYRHRFSRTVEVLRGAAIPVFATIIGACVLAVMLAVFLPMIEIIDHLNRVVWRF